MPDDSATATMSGQSNPPNGGEVSSTAPPPQENGGAMQSWLNTVNSAPKPQTASAATPDTISQQPQKLQTVPVPVTSMKRGGFLGVMDGITDALVGKQRPELGKDPDGNVYIKAHTMTRGEQWMRIAGEAMTGAAAGLAAGKGAGNMGKAPLAGMQAQQAQADREAAQMDKTVLDNANNQMLRMKMAEQAWRNTRLQTEADQHDVEFSQGQEDRLTKAGATLLGTVAHPGDLTGVLKVNPDLMKDLVKNHSLEFTPHFTDGKRDGFKVYKTAEGYRSTLVPPGAEFPTFNAVNGTYDWHKTTDTETQGALDDYWTKAGVDSQKFKGDQKEQELKDAQKKEADATAREKTELLPGQKQKLTAETSHLNAETDLAKEKKKQVKAGVINDDGTPNPRFELMAEGILDGSILPPDLKRQAKGMGLDPNQIIGRAMEIAQARGQQFSLPIIEQEHKFASNPKTQAALDGIDRVIGAPGAPGYIQQMLSLAKAADLGPVGAGNSVVLAVKRAYGDTAAKNLNTSIDETRRSIAGLIGNPLLGGSDTDKKLQQAEDMLGSSPTLENLEGATEVLSQALATSRNSMVQNNRYLRQRYGTRGVGPAGAGGPGTAKTPPAAPAGAAGTALNKSDNKQHYVDAQGKDLGVAE